MVRDAGFSPKPAVEMDAESGLRVRFGLAQADDLVAGFELAAFLKHFDPLKAFEDVAFRGNGAGSL